MQQQHFYGARFAAEPRRRANTIDMATPPFTSEIDFLQSLLPLAVARIVEAGGGAAHLARERVSRHPTTEVVGIEVDALQLDKNQLTPVERLRFEKDGAQAIPFPEASFDGALMPKCVPPPRKPWTGRWPRGAGHSLPINASSPRPPLPASTSFGNA